MVNQAISAMNPPVANATTTRIATTANHLGILWGSRRRGWSRVSTRKNTVAEDTLHPLIVQGPRSVWEHRSTPLRQKGTRAMDPLNVDDLGTVSLTSSASDDAAWIGGYFAYGGKDADKSTVIYFAVPTGKRLGKHVDTREETQFILGGS